MELIQEEHCSHGVVRLTCRSLKAFIFIVEADYLPNLAHICRRDALKLLPKRMSLKRGSAELKNKRLKGNYVEDPEQEGLRAVDIRESVNRR